MNKTFTNQIRTKSGAGKRQTAGKNRDTHRKASNAKVAKRNVTKEEMS